MANIESQKKRNRQNVVRHDRNQALRSELKTRSKRVLEAVEAGDAAAAEEALRLAQQRYDAAVGKGVIKKSTASRRKSRLARAVSRLG